MTSMLRSSIDAKKEQVKALEKKVSSLKEELMNMDSLNTLAGRLPGFVTLVESSDNEEVGDNSPLEIYVNTYPGADDAYEAIRAGNYFHTRKAAEDSSSFGCIKIVKLVEAMPDEGGDDLVFINLYLKDDGHSDRDCDVYGFIGQTEAESRRSVDDSLIHVGRVSIKRPKEC